MVIEIRQGIPHLERDLCFHQFLYCCPAAKIRAEQKRHLFIRTAVFLRLPQLLGNGTHLLARVLISPDCNWSAFLVVGGNRLFIPLFVVVDQALGPLHDKFRTTVIFIEHYLRRARVIFRKIQHDLRSCSTEMIDRLIIISHHKQIVLRCCQHLHDIILKMIDILKLIHQNIPEFFLPCCQNIFSFTQKLIAAQKHIVKIKLSSFIQDFPIPLKNLPEHFIRTAGRIIMCQ